MLLLPLQIDSETGDSPFWLALLSTPAGVGNLPVFTTMGRMSRALLLAGRKIKSFYLKILRLSMYEEE